MGDSPRSDHFQSRFSTPVNELDDHRFQPESLPRAEVQSPGARRGTRRSTAVEASDLLQVQTALPQGVSSRDFEHAIEDDDRSDHGSLYRSPSGRRGSINASGARRSTFRRTRPLLERHSRSRASSTSRSPSPPNSVDAFAEPRRRERAGTLESIARSFVSVRPSTANAGVDPVRQRTLSSDDANNTINNARADNVSDEGSVEDDVCFPQEEDYAKPYTIDFEDLEEFISKDRMKTPIPHPFEHDIATSEAHRARVFEDLRRKSVVSSIPIIQRQDATPDRTESGSTTRVDFDDKELDEKVLEDKLEGVGEKRCGAHQAENITRWSFFSSELEETVHAPELGDLLIPGETFEHLFQLGPHGGAWWLDILMPTEEEVEVICKAFGVHGLTREDIVQQETREKVELFKSYYFVCFRSFYQMNKESEYYMEPVNVYAVVFREGIITFTFCPSPHASNVRKRMGKLREYISISADWLCYALIDDIVDSFGPVIRSIEHETDAIEDLVFTARAEDSRAILRQIGECRKKVMSLIRLLGGKADVVKGFAKRCNEQYSMTPRQDVGMYLSDVQDHVVTMMSNLGHFEKILSRSHSNYLAQISVDNIAQGNKANQVLSKVTFIATILVPLNLVCGLFGMNVEVPGKNTEGLGWFFGIVGCLILFIVVSVGIAKRCRVI